jgi:hypothetical protein
MSNTNENVRELALEELSADYTEYNGFSDDVSFQVWVLAVVDRVIERFSALAVKASKTWDLDNINMFDAAVFETVARLQERLENQSYISTIQAQSITVGPITISPPRISSVITGFSAVGEEYHRRAMARLAAEGIGRRRAGARSFAPYKGVNCP